MFFYFSTWRGLIVQATEAREGPDGPPTYEVRAGYCGIEGCCGPRPLLMASAMGGDDE
jgi:hypothetical protein